MILHPKNYRKMPISHLNSIQNLPYKGEKIQEISRFENLDSGPGPGFQKNSWPDPGPGVQEKSRSRNYPGSQKNLDSGPGSRKNPAWIQVQVRSLIKNTKFGF
jgi:hypothetical protein